MDLDRLQVGPRPGGGGRVVALFGRQRYHAVVFDGNYLHRMQVDDRDDVFYGSGIAVVIRTRPNPRQRARESTTLLSLQTEVARGPRVHHAQAEVGDAAFAHGRLPLGAGFAGFLALEELVQHDRRLHARDLLPRHHRPTVERDDCLVRPRGRVVQQDCERLAIDRPRGRKLQYGCLGRLVQTDADEADALAELAFAPQDGDGGRDLVDRQRFEWMSEADAALEGGCHVPFLSSG